MSINNKWLSAYVFHSGYLYSYESDRIILEIIQPFIKQCLEKSWIEKYFFIRYSEGGTHIRIRFYGEESILESKVKNEFESFVKRNFPDDLKLDSPDYEMLKWIDYEPEIDRYGGEYAIEVAEEFFFYSSEFCISLLSEIENGDNSQRLGKGLIATNLIIYAFTQNLLLGHQMADRYHNGYLFTIAKKDEVKNNLLELFQNGYNKQSDNLIEFINTMWEVLENGIEMPKSFETFYKNLLIISEKLKELDIQKKLINDESNYSLEQKYFKIVPSYIHMMNNRLGISIPEESYLTFLITQALQTEIPQGEINER